MNSVAPAEKVEQALDVMLAGIRIEALGSAPTAPEANDAEIDRRLRKWLTQEG